MTYHPVRYIFLTLAVAVLMLAVTNGGGVLAQEPDSMMGPELVYITSPAEGETVSDIITVTGAVDFIDFKKYEVFLKSGDNLVWGATGFAPVINGNLARLDTKIFMDSTYQIVIRKVGSDSNYTDTYGPSFTIANNLGAPLPHAEVESSILYTPQSGYALARIKNCTGSDMEFDYQGFKSSGCSHDNLWIMPKLEEAPLCTSVDVLLVPCEYRGTAVSTGDQERGATFQTVVTAGKVYVFDYAGEGRLYIGETDGEERAETDLGDLDPNDPARLEAIAPKMDEVAEEVSVEVSKTVVVVAPAPAEAQSAAPADTVVVVEKTEVEVTEAQEMLPESGKAGVQAAPYFIISGIGVILLMVVGGIIAMRRGKQAA